MLSSARQYVAHLTGVHRYHLAYRGRPATDWVGLFKVGEADNHNYISRAYINGTVTGKAALAGPTEAGQYEVRYLKADSFTDLAVTSNQIEIGTVNRQYQMDGQGSIEAMTQKLWGGYNFQQNEYWTDAWGNSNSPADSDRLRAIADGNMTPTRWDLNFYTHELREFVRYRKLGWKSGEPADMEEAREIWVNTHTATLEDYGLPDKNNILFHPAAAKYIPR